MSSLDGVHVTRFESLQRSLVPRSQHFSAEERYSSLLLVNTLLEDQPAKSVKKLIIFMLLIDVTALIRFRGRFRDLSDSQKNRILHSFFNSPIALFRKGFWGLNTLARLGVYGQTGLHEEIGYRLRKNADG